LRKEIEERIERRYEILFFRGKSEFEAIDTCAAFDAARLEYIDGDAGSEMPGFVAGPLNSIYSRNLNRPAVDAV